MSLQPCYQLDTSWIMAWSRKTVQDCQQRVLWEAQCKSSNGCKDLIKLQPLGRQIPRFYYWPIGILTGVMFRDCWSFDQALRIPCSVSSHLTALDSIWKQFSHWYCCALRKTARYSLDALHCTTALSLSNRIRRQQIYHFDCDSIHDWHNHKRSNHSTLTNPSESGTANLTSQFTIMGFQDELRSRNFSLYAQVSPEPSNQRWTLTRTVVGSIEYNTGLCIGYCQHLSLQSTHSLEHYPPVSLKKSWRGSI